jgi:hypothetical protein
MRKTFKRFERVPVEVVQKIVEQQSHFSKSDGDPNEKSKPLSRKLRRAARRFSTFHKKVKVLIP